MKTVVRLFVATVLAAVTLVSCQSNETVMVYPDPDMINNWGLHVDCRTTETVVRTTVAFWNEESQDWEEAISASCGSEIVNFISPDGETVWFDKPRQTFQVLEEIQSDHGPIECRGFWMGSLCENGEIRVYIDTFQIVAIYGFTCGGNTFWFSSTKDHINWGPWNSTCNEENGEVRIEMEWTLGDFTDPTPIKWDYAMFEISLVGNDHSFVATTENGEQSHCYEEGGIYDCGPIFFTISSKLPLWSGGAIQH